MKHHISLILSYFILVINLLRGCSASQWVNYNGIDYKPDTENLVEYEFDLKISKQPSLLDPKFELSLIKYPLFQKLEVTQQMEESKFSHVKTAWFVISLFATWLVYGLATEGNLDFATIGGQTLGGWGQLWAASTFYIHIFIR